MEEINYPLKKQKQVSHLYYTSGSCWSFLCAFKRLETIVPISTTGASVRSNTLFGSADSLGGMGSVGPEIKDEYISFSLYISEENLPRENFYRAYIIMW